MWQNAETVEELERMILGPFTDDEKKLLVNDFPTLARLHSIEPDNVKTINFDSSVFTIDSAGDENLINLADAVKKMTSKTENAESTESEVASKESKTKSKNTDLSTEARQALIKELSHPPTELQIPPMEVEVSKAKSREPEIMKKSVLAMPGFEKRHSVPAYNEGKKALARKRRQEKATTKAGWFDMKAPEMTEELEADLEAMQMRGSAASWTGYKKNDYKNGPKFFQIATVEDSPLDFYTTRVPKKNRKRTIVDELLADAEFRKTNKKMYVQAAEKLNKRHPNKKGGRYKKSRA